MNIQKIYIGGWFQRTTLHLSEIYDFLKEAKSELALDQEKLRSLCDALEIGAIEMKIANLDYIQFRSKKGIEVKIFEDGLIVLNNSQPNGAIKDLIGELTSY